VPVTGDSACHRWQCRTYPLLHWAGVESPELSSWRSRNTSPTFQNQELGQLETRTLVTFKCRTVTGKVGERALSIIFNSIFSFPVTKKNSEFLERHSKAKHTRAPAYSWALLVPHHKVNPSFNYWCKSTHFWTQCLEQDESLVFLAYPQWLCVIISSLYIHSFIPAISIAPLQVHYYSEPLPTKHKYCVEVSHWSATGNCERRTCPRSLRG